MPDDSLKSKVLHSELSDFRKRVLLATLEIPKGKVTTYGAIGKTIGCKGAQAIGGALRNNPFAPDVPCHRVVDSKLKLHGFMGKTDNEAINKKRRLLEAEGVIFVDELTVSKESLN